MQKLADRLISLRKEQTGLNTKQFSQKLNIKYETYYGWEKQKANPDIKTLTELAQFFNVSTDYLLGLSDIRTAAEPEPLLKNINQEQKEVVKALLQLNSIQLARAHGYILGLTSKNPNIFDL